MIALLRRGTQVLTLALLVLLPLLNRKGITFVSGTLYSLSVGPVWITDPLIGAQTILTTLTMDRVLLLSLAAPVLFTLIFGRVFCGWICPQNTLSELVDRASAAFGIRRPVTPRRPRAFPRMILLAAILVLLALTGIPLASLLSAPGIMSVQTAQIITQGTVGLELALIGLIVVTELFLVRRAWCNYVCPVGSFLGILRTPRTMKIAFEPDAQRPCGKCLACADACRLGLDPMQAGLYPQCHNCGACVEACRAMKAGKKPLAFKF